MSQREVQPPPAVQPKKKLTRYQSFPGDEGGSQSFDKLKCLRLPPMTGKSFMDVGCNEGFFCGYALFDDARRSVGIEMNPGFVERARARFPGCEFLQQTWDTLPDEKFDVILLASALHYAENQAALIARLVNHLTPDGTLVLELGVASGPDSAWIPVKRSIDTRYFPTWPKLREVLAPYAWKYIGKSVMQVGDPIGRYVIHIRHRRPFAYLLMLPSGYGKTYVSQSLFPKAGVPLIMGDVLLDDIAGGKIAVSPALKACMARSYVKGESDRTLREIFAAGLGHDYLSVWAAQAGGKDFAFDGFVPAKQQAWVVNALVDLGYFPVRLDWEQVGSALISPAGAETMSQNYYDFLANGGVKAEKLGSTLPAGASPRAPTPVTRRTAKPYMPRMIAAIGHLTGLRRTPHDNLRNRWKKEGTTGFIDTVRVKGRVVTLGGWALNPEGRLPRILDFKVGQARQTLEDVTPVARPDVQRAIGLGHPKVGFDIDLFVEEEMSVAEVVAQLIAQAGDTPEAMSPPLRISSSLLGRK